MELLNPPYNTELMQMLNGFSEWFFKQDLSKIPLKNKDKANKGLFYTSEGHLLDRQQQESVRHPEIAGYPSECYGIDLMAVAREGAIPQSMVPAISDINRDLNAWFGSKFCAVQMYYPPGGYMNWHHNANCPGYNILMSYSQDGNGFFRYQDPVSKEIITMEDVPGWTAKVGYYGPLNEPDKVIWHCAKTFSGPRLTFGYVIPDEAMWEMMCEDILLSA